MNNYLLLFQKQTLVENGYEPAKSVTVFKLDGKALEEALKQVRYNYTPWVIAFKNLPPTKLLVRACEEAIRSGRGQLLPLANKPRSRCTPAVKVSTGSRHE